MIHRARLLLFFAIACLLAIALAAPRFALRYRRQLDAQPAAVARWEDQIREARQQRDALLRQLKAAQQRPARAATTDIAPLPAPDLAQLTETERWVRQVKQLKQLFAQQPEQSIPELGLLDDHDWLGLARRVQLDTEEHRQRAFAIVRNGATERCAQLMRDALNAYVKANHGQLPVETAELQPYFSEPSLDPAILAHYAIVRSGALRDAPEGPVLKLKALVDEKYDADVHIDRAADSTLTSGSEQKRNPEDPNDPGSLNDQIEHDVNIAVRGFVAAHPGALPQRPADLLPYFDPPLGPAMTETMRRPLSPEQQREFEADIAKRATAFPRK